MNLYRSLISHNPMKAEIRRFRNRYLRRGTKGGASFAVTVIALSFYVLLLIWIGTSLREGAVMAISQICLVAVTLGVPIAAYTMIAGERERRSWDLLLVAPITSAQIVVGKF